MTHGRWAVIADGEVAEVCAALFAPEVVEQYPVICRVAAQIWVRWARGSADIARRGEVTGGRQAEPRPPVGARR